MAVTGFNLHWNGSTGTVTQSDGSISTRYSAVYRVYTDDPLDGPVIVLQWFQGSALVPWLGDFYLYGNDHDPQAFVESIDPQREDGDKSTWVVTVNFSTQSSKWIDNDGKPTDDPLEAYERVQVSQRMKQRAVEKAKYIDGYHSTTEAMFNLNTGKFDRTVINSAGKPFSPPPAEEHSQLIVRITKNEFGWILDPVLSSNLVQSSFNSEEWNYSNAFLGAVFTVEAYHGFCLSVMPSFKTFAKDGCFVAYAETTYTFLVDLKYDLRHSILDRGYAARREAGDPDGKGGTVSLTAIVPGRAAEERIKDIDGDASSEPTLLDGKGQPLPSGEDPIFGKWQWEREFDFNLLDIGD